MLLLFFIGPINLSFFQLPNTTMETVGSHMHPGFKSHENAIPDESEPASENDRKDERYIPLLNVHKGEPALERTRIAKSRHTDQNNPYGGN